MTDQLVTQVQELWDKQAIREVIWRYCRGIDRCDLEIMRSTYHPDSIDIHGSFEGTGWGWCEYIVELLPTRWDFTYHTIPNLLIEIENDTASCESYVLAYQAQTVDGKRIMHTFWGRYIDRVERREGEWKIAHRTAVCDWTEEGAQITSRVLPPDTYVLGKRNRSDLSYSSSTKEVL